MRRLLLMRHAKAVRQPGLADHARPLNERGADDALRIAQWLRAHGLSPDAAMASDSRRTRETLELVNTVFDPPPPARLDASLYLAEPHEILTAIRAAPPDARRLLLIGHNPGVADLAVALTGRGAPQDVKRLAESFPTSAVAVIAFDAQWKDVEELAGRLERFLVARHLREDASR